MATIIVDFQIRIVDDEMIRKLHEKTLEAGNDLVEIFELPGVCIKEIVGMSVGNEPLDLNGVEFRIRTATLGEPPTAILFVRKENTIDMRRHK